MWAALHLLDKQSVPVPDCFNYLMAVYNLTWPKTRMKY
jgi:hypothetical protein